MRAGGIAAGRRDGGDVPLAIVDHCAGPAHPLGSQDAAQRGSLLGKTAAQGGGAESQQTGEVLPTPRVHRRKGDVMPDPLGNRGGAGLGYGWDMADQQQDFHDAMLGEAGIKTGAAKHRRGMGNGIDDLWRQVDSWIMGFAR